MSDASVNPFKRAALVADPSAPAVPDAAPADLLEAADDAPTALQEGSLALASCASQTGGLEVASASWATTSRWFML